MENTNTYTITISSYTNRESKLTISVIDDQGRIKGNRVVTSVKALINTLDRYEGYAAAMGMGVERHARRVSR